MSERDVRLNEYLDRLRSQVSDAAVEVAADGDEVGATAFREDAFTSVVVGHLEELGQLPDTAPCYVNRRLGRGTCKVNGWSIDENSGEATLVTTVFSGMADIMSVTKTKLNEVVDRAVRTFDAAKDGLHSEMEPASETFDMLASLHDAKEGVDRLRVVVLVDGMAPDAGFEQSHADVEVRVDVWDLRRLFRAEASGLPYEPIEIDLVERLGKPLPCVMSPRVGNEFDVYLAVLPGELLHSLYHEHGARLLELNVRSFLQARGKVNRGIRETLRKEPESFIAYNNGISATAEFVETTSEQHEAGIAIKKLRGLQVVNGGQTVASIHRARDRDRQDVSRVFVQAKITVVGADHVESLVPLISRYANTQNTVNEADFSANHPFHVAMQQLSKSVWTPGEQSQWFYERARGQYQVAQQKDGGTRAQLARFKKVYPVRQRFDKVQLARSANAWSEMPHVVSRGGQKNFVAFMQRLGEAHPALWEPDAEYFRGQMSRMIVYKLAEKTARQHAFPAYRANAVAYTVALLSYRTAGRIDLVSIWNDQATSPPLAKALVEWMPGVHEALVESADGRNVTEWCKKVECWRHIQTLDVVVNDELERELSSGQSLPAMRGEAKAASTLSATDRENIARVMQTSAEEWVRISGWGARTGSLKDWQSGIATTLASYAAAGWRKVPSQKQAKHGVAIARIASEGAGTGSDTADI